jgi:hypothetical protein
LSEGIKISLGGKAPDVIQKLNAKYPAYVTMAIGDLSHSLADNIRSSFLHGKALEMITGQTEESVKAFYEKRSQSWFVRVGVGVSGSLNYLAKWTGTEHEFMSPGFDEFKRNTNILDYLIKNVEAKIK